ncbi:MAG: Eco57I restriction-modification methylase domain-containing protein, partial [Dysgonomonas sp.]
MKTPKQALSPAFLKQKPDRKEIELFKDEFISLLDKINDTESEEFHKNLIIDFLNSVYYKNNYYINTYGRTDLVIHNEKNTKSPVGVLIEVKKPTNKSEMITIENLNAKACQELVLYYLMERKTNKNLELRYLIITYINEWFIFDAQDFKRLFYDDKKFVGLFEQFDSKRSDDSSTSHFYKEIAAPKIEKVKNQITYTYFDIRTYDKIIRNNDKEDDRKLIALYKFLSPIHLLKLPFAKDSNELNKEFYAELLHILGLEEVKEKSQKFIVRKAKGKRDNGSIIENAINELDAMDKLSMVSNVKQYGNTYEDQLYNVALDLSITWVNRILFLKLLEAQIIKYHNGNKTYSFLSTDKIEGYDDLNSLFFQILARKEEERREGSLKNRFSHVPYLNSSLFEPTELEGYTIAISALQDKAKVELYSKSVLRTKNGEQKELTPLEYLLKFLDAYDFSSESSEDIQEEDKALISASVLGLIFEKINGYKDGSFFTPSFITMFMCRDTITRAVIQKFNEIKGWECKTNIDLHNKISDIKEANEIFNSIRLCDPAVGSGHFLVSSLNEMIYLKSSLGILADKEGKVLKEYKISIENDELIISDNESSIFKYTPYQHESQRVQETLFHEKQTIIENCLFGVDINPNSVKICQLRLWIELLKHTYYKSGTKQLETLPNIYINIKCGNSLISKYPVKIGQSIEKNVDKRTSFGKLISEYKRAVIEYKNANEKHKKKEVTESLLRIKSQIFQNVQLELFEDNSKALESDIYKHSLEWMIEFPEVLDEEGKFIGFDAVIGNPPY